MLELIRTRLQSRLPASRWPGGVEIAEDIDELTRLAGMVDDSTAIVMPFREQAAPSPVMTAGFRQRVGVQIAVGAVVRVYDQMMGAERAVRFDSLTRDLEQALAGWQPPEVAAPFELVGGESSPIDKGVSIYVQTWETARFLTGAPT